MNKHLINPNTKVKEVLKQFDILASDSIVFIVDENNTLLGSLTDGDIRRGLIKGLSLEDDITSFSKPNPHFLKERDIDIDLVHQLRGQNFKIIPILNSRNEVVDILNFRIQKSFLPIDVVIMAGGRGKRLMPLTNDTPKPLLRIGEKPILEHNIDRLKEFGIKNITITVNYLGEQIENYFKSGEEKNLNISYIRENEPLGTLGALSLISEFNNEYILVMNSDLLTNIDYEDIFNDIISKDGDIIIATYPHSVKIPYGVLELEDDVIISFAEKPTYTYYSNAGIYIFKKEYVDWIPRGMEFDAPSLVELMINKQKKVLHYPILGYWLDIGKPEDFSKAKRDITHIKF